MKVTKEQFIGVTYDELLAENEKLREEFNKMDVWHSKELTAAMDENAKLRELVADMLSEDMDQHWPEFTRRARELGVDE